MADRVRELLNKVLEWWNKFSTRQKTFIISVDLRRSASAFSDHVRSAFSAIQSIFRGMCSAFRTVFHGHTPPSMEISRNIIPQIATAVKQTGFDWHTHGTRLKAVQYIDIPKPYHPKP